VARTSPPTTTTTMTATAARATSSFIALDQRIAGSAAGAASPLTLLRYRDEPGATSWNLFFQVAVQCALRIGEASPNAGRRSSPAPEPALREITYSSVLPVKLILLPRAGIAVVGGGSRNDLS
jgi:hypothetical protein